MSRKKPDLSNVNLNAQPILMTPEELFELASQAKLVKKVSTEVDLGKMVVLHDISVKAKGPIEDDIFASDVNLHHNIRRGLTVVSLPDGEKVIARKGLPKFFDISIEDLDPLAKPNKKLQEILRWYTLGSVYKAIDQEDAVISIHKLEKANGENAQVSFLPELAAWVICSKNVSLLAREPNDLPLYSDSRFGFAKLIAEAWFDQISKISNQNLDLLKKVLSDNTFVGEYCGNPAYQHLVAYQNTHVRFYAVVNKKSEEPCWPPEKAFVLFDKLGLIRVQSEVQSVNTAADFSKSMKELYKFISGKSVEEEGEGAVVYFVLNKRNVLSLGKLKTLEYRLFRKLREKLKTLIQNKGDKLQLIYSKYVKECGELCTVAKPSKDIEYYHQIANEAMQLVNEYLFNLYYRYVQKNKQENQLIKLKNFISSKFIDFISLVRDGNDKNQTVSIEQLDHLLSQVVCVDSEESDQEEPQPIEEAKDQSKKVKNHIPVIEQVEKKVYIVFPLTIPGSGKTVLAKCLKQFIKDKEFEFLSISNDQIRRELMDTTHSKKPHDVAYKASEDQAKNIYRKQMIQVLDQAVRKLFILLVDSKQFKVIIFFDKNHPNNATTHPLQVIGEYKGKYKTIEFITVALVPKCSTRLQGYSYSLDYLLACISRSIQRTDHETLVGSPEKVASIIIWFFNMFQSRGKTGQWFDKTIKFPFTNEIPIPQEVNTFFESFLKDVSSNKKPKQLREDYPAEIAKCIEYANSIDWGFPSLEFQLEALNSFWNN